MKHIQIILDTILPFVCNLMEKYGEFYPLSAVMNNDFTVEHILLNENLENDNPSSISVINELKKELKLKKEKIVAYAIFYDVFLHDKKIDAFAVSVENKIENDSYIIYFPYKLTNKKIKLFESFKNVKEKEIFIH